MTGAGVLARNLMVNWGGHAANLLVMVFLSPFVVHTLGQVEYGLWYLLMVMAGYMGIFDLGVRASTGRHVVLYLGRGDHEAVRSTIQTGLGFFSLFGLLVLLLGVGLGWMFPRFFPRVPPEYYGLVRILVPMMAANVLLSAYGAIFGSVLVAHDRFDLCRAVDLVVLAVRTAGTVVALKGGYRITGLTVVLLAGNLLSLAGNYVLARRIYPRLVVRATLSRARLRELLRYGAGAFISDAGVIVISQTPGFVVGVVLGLAAVAVYGVGAMLPFYGATFLVIIGYTFFPPVQRALARGELGTARLLLFRQISLALSLGMGLYVGFIFFGRSFLRLWMEGPDFDAVAVAQAAQVLRIVSIAGLLYLPIIGCREALNALGHIRFNAVVTAVEAALNLGLSVAILMLRRPWGLAGVALATVVALILGRGVLIPWYACRKLQIPAGQFLRSVGKAGGMTLAALMGWCWFVRWLIPADSWSGFWLQIGLVVTGYVPMVMFGLVPEQDRARLAGWLGWRRAAVDRGQPPPGNGC